MDGGSRTGRETTKAQRESSSLLDLGAGIDGCPLELSLSFSYSDNTFDKVLIHWIFVL